MSSFHNSTGNALNTSKTNYGSHQQNIVSHKVGFQHNSIAPQNPIIPSPLQQNLHLPVNVEQNCSTPQGIISNISVNGSQMAAENFTASLNCVYGNAICNSPASSIMQLPCNTLIIPPTHSTMPQPNSMFRQISVPQNNFLPSAIEINQNSQLSYVGSITITNNETVSLAVNVPDSVVPVYPQQDLSFNVLQSPLQLQQTSEIHLSSVNVQQISVHSSYPSPPLNQIVFPTQTVNIPQNQVMFIEEAISQPVPSPHPTPNYILQVPQPQNCSFNSYLSQPEYHQQFSINQGTYNSNPQEFSQAELNNVFQQQNVLQQQLPDAPPRLEPAITPQTYLTSSSSKDNSYKEEKMSRTQSSLNEPVRLTPTPTASSPNFSDLSSRSSPAPDKSSNSGSSSANLQPNSNIMDILKKAAEQMLSMSSSKKKASSTESAQNSSTEEKKSRFVHTRKVAALRAEKLKKKKSVFNGKLESPNKPRSIQLNIAALKKAFMPFLVAPVAKDESSPVPLTVEPPKSPPKPVVEPVEPKAVILPPPPPPPPVEKSNTPCFYEEESDEEDSPLLKAYFREQDHNGKDQESSNHPYLMYEITSEDGLHVRSRNVREIWEKVYEELQDARIAAHMDHKTVSPEDINGFHMMGLDNSALIYLLEQLPGAEQCLDYEFLFHRPSKDQLELPVNPTGCARTEPFDFRRDYDMFNFLASEYRTRPVYLPPEEEEEGSQKSSRRATNFDVPLAMRFKGLKTVARETVGVYRSIIHGRGLFCKRNIDPGELVIEYAGEVIRSVLTDKRERIYQSKGIGCYMFRIDDDEVVDATMHGNAARFINHSCEPNCFSKVITVDGKKHIVIFALRKIVKGEELTYDYKFPFEDEKIPCHCNSRRCRKYLN